MWIVLVGLALVTKCKFFNNHDLVAAVVILLQIVAGAVLAFCMEVAEFLVVTHTSSLTLSVAGVFKVWNTVSQVFNKSMVRFLCTLLGWIFAVCWKIQCVCNCLHAFHESLSLNHSALVKIKICSKTYVYHIKQLQYWTK